MAWVRVDDNWATHPKVMGLSLAACGLWIKALCHCNEHRTDGLIRGGAVAGLAASTPKSRLKKIVEELVGAGLWVVDGLDFRVHDYHDYQPSSSDLSERDARISSVRRSAGSIGGKRSGEARRAKQSGSKSESPIPDPIPNTTTTTDRAPAHEASMVPMEPPPPTRPSTELPIPPPDLDDGFELPPDLCPAPEPTPTNSQSFGPMSVRGVIPTSPPSPRHSIAVAQSKGFARRTESPPTSDQSSRAAIIRTMLGLEAYRKIEETYGAQYQSPLIEIFADHCEGTAGMIGCPMDRLPKVVEQVAVEMAGETLLHGAPPKPDLWLSKIRKFVEGAKKWRQEDAKPSNTSNATTSPRMASTSGGGGVGRGRPGAGNRQGPKVQRDSSGACGVEAAERHSSEVADALLKIGKTIGY
jgi:hypothetical protein